MIARGGIALRLTIANAAGVIRVRHERGATVLASATAEDGVCEVALEPSFVGPMRWSQDTRCFIERQQSSVAHPRSDGSSAVEWRTVGTITVRSRRARAVAWVATAILIACAVFWASADPRAASRVRWALDLLTALLCAGLAVFPWLTKRWCVAARALRATPIAALLSLASLWATVTVDNQRGDGSAGELTLRAGPTRWARWEVRSNSSRLVIAGRAIDQGNPCELFAPTRRTLRGALGPALAIARSGSAVAIERAAARALGIEGEVRCRSVGDRSELCCVDGEASERGLVPRYRAPPMRERGRTALVLAPGPEIRAANFTVLDELEVALSSERVWRIWDERQPNLQVVWTSEPTGMSGPALLPIALGGSRVMAQCDGAPPVRCGEQPSLLWSLHVGAHTIEALMGNAWSIAFDPRTGVGVYCGAMLSELEPKVRAQLVDSSLWNERYAQFKLPWAFGWRSLEIQVREATRWQSIGTVSRRYDAARSYTVAVALDSALGLVDRIELYPLLRRDGSMVLPAATDVVAPAQRTSSEPDLTWERGASGANLAFVALIATELDELALARAEGREAAFEARVTVHGGSTPRRARLRRVDHFILEAMSTEADDAARSSR